MRRRRRRSEPCRFDVALGATIRRRRRANGWTLDALATSSRVARERLAAIEEGRRRVGGDEMLALWPRVGGTSAQLLALWRRHRERAVLAPTCGRALRLAGKRAALKVVVS